MIRACLSERGRRASCVASLVMLCLWLSGFAPVSAQGRDGAWTTPEDLAAPFFEGEDLSGILLCDRNQNLHIVWGKSHGSRSEIYYRTDAGGALSDPTDVLALPDPVAVRLSAAITWPDATLHVTWQNAYIAGDLFYSRAPLALAGDARAWTAPRLMAPGADAGGLSVDAAGLLHFFYGASAADGYGNAVYHMRSEDGGATWSEPAVVYEATPPAPSTIWPSAAFDGRGRAHLGITVRTQEYGLYSEVGYMRSPDGGQTWEPYRAIAVQSDPTPNVSVIAPFVFGADEIHLTWHDPRRMHMWSADGGTTWSTPVEIIRLGAGFGGANFLAKDSAGRLYVLVGVKSGVYSAEWNGAEWTRHVKIEGRNMDPHGQELVVCQGNVLHAVWSGGLPGEDGAVWYAHRQVDAPHIAPSPLPAAAPIAPAATRAAGAIVSAEPTGAEPVPQPTRRVARAAPPRAEPNPAAPLFIASASVLVFLVAALAWSRAQNR